MFGSITLFICLSACLGLKLLKKYCTDLFEFVL